MTEYKINYTIDKDVLNKLIEYGILESESTRSLQQGSSNYSKHLIQPWAIWKEYNLNPWDADIIKRTLRIKGVSEKEQIENRILDYKKIIHICNERIRQLTVDKY